MKLFLFSLLAFGLALLGMSLGVIFSDRRIRGSCGGLSTLPGRHGKVACEGCPSGGNEGGKGCAADSREHAASKA